MTGPPGMVGLGLSGLGLALGTAATVAMGTISVAAWAPSPPDSEFMDPDYDGSYTFVRVRFGGGGSELSRFGGFGRGPAWAHDHPRADRNFLEILGEITLIDPEPDGHRVLTMDDPEIFRYPIAYIVEVGRWAPDEAELDALSDWLRKGGFLIVDDFAGRDLNRIAAIFDYAMPGLRLMEVPTGHPIYDSFFRIDDPGSLVPPYGGRVPVYLGLFEENDPEGRMMAILNYNNDIAEYWEYSDRGYYPIDLANEAYKFGVNYIVHGMTR